MARQLRLRHYIKQILLQHVQLHPTQETLQYQLSL
nr:MAG TPA: hypothetical protein [Bacteriophage sp.]